MATVRIDKSFTPEADFWTMNPWFRLIPQYKNLYDTDGGDTESSMYGWCSIFYSDPDEEINPFYAMSPEHRSGMLKETYFPDFDDLNPFFLECCEVYPTLLTLAEQELVDKKEAIMRKRQFIKSTPITLDQTVLDDMTGKMITKKGTATQLTQLEKSLSADMKDLAVLEELFAKQKAQGEVFGGRQETLGEKGLI